MTHTTQRHRSRCGLKTLFAVLIVAALTTSGLARDRPARTYSLASAPLEVFDRLPDLQMGTVPPLAEVVERKLLAQVWEQRGKQVIATPADDELLLEAMLFASGVAEAKARANYRERFEKLVVGARQAVHSARNDRERGERLLRFLQASVMSKGYQEGQTSFAAVFDTGKFNCVSSTAMYYLVCTRLGLRLRALSIPGSQFLAGHAFGPTPTCVFGSIPLRNDRSSIDMGVNHRSHGPGAVIA